MCDKFNVPAALTSLSDQAAAKPVAPLRDKSSNLFFLFPFFFLTDLLAVWCPPPIDSRADSPRRSEPGHMDEHKVQSVTEQAARYAAAVRDGH